MHHGGGDLEYQLPMSAGPSLPAYSGGNMDMSMYAMSSSPHASFSYAYEAHSQHSHFPLPPGPPPTMRHAHSVPPIQHAGQHPQDYPYGRQPLSSASATPTSAPHSSPFLHFEQHSHAPAAFDMHSHSHFDPTPKSVRTPAEMVPTALSPNLPLASLQGAAHGGKHVALGPAEQHCLGGFVFASGRQRWLCGLVRRPPPAWQQGRQRGRTAAGRRRQRQQRQLD